MNPTFSIIVPCFNKASRIDKMFWRLVNGKTPREDFEVILIDGASPDNISDVCKFYKDQLNLIYIDTNNSRWENPSRPRNIGYRCAKGKYSIMLDADYLPAEDLLEQFRDSLKDDYFDICYGYAVDSSKGIGWNEKVFENLISLYPSKSPVEIYKLPIETMARALMIPMDGPMPEWLFCIKTKVMKEIGGYDEDYKGWGREDSDIFKRLKVICPKQIYNPKASCIHIFHNSAGPQGIRDVSYNHKIFEEKCRGLPGNVVRNLTKWGYVSYGGNCLVENDKIIAVSQVRYSYRSVYCGHQYASSTGRDPADLYADCITAGFKGNNEKLPNINVSWEKTV